MLYDPGRGHKQCRMSCISICSVNFIMEMPKTLHLEYHNLSYSLVAYVRKKSNRGPDWIASANLSATLQRLQVDRRRMVTPACSLGLSATNQQYFSLTTNQPPATSQQYFPLRANHHQSSATSQTNRLVRWFLKCFFLLGKEDRCSSSVGDVDAHLTR
jgi:hypothetical protein